jgi:hypothetical protein
MSKILLNLCSKFKRDMQFYITSNEIFTQKKQAYPHQYFLFSLGPSESIFDERYLSFDILDKKIL